MLRPDVGRCSHVLGKEMKTLSRRVDQEQDPCWEMIDWEIFRE